MVWTLVVGIIAALARGQWPRLVHLGFRVEEERAADSVFRALESGSGRARLKTLMDELYAERMRLNDSALARAISVADANKQTLEGVTQSQLLQGAAIKEVSDKVREVPRLINALESLAETTANISKEMQAINLSMARIDEREKERERRWHDERPHPGRRSNDQ